jgi:hypothetical protein
VIGGDAHTSMQDAALLADMLSLPNDGRYPALDFAPEQRRQRTLQALVSQMEALARQNPVPMTFEDAHCRTQHAWKCSVELRIGLQAFAHCCSLRPGPSLCRPGSLHVTALTLNGLPKRDIDVMIDRIVGNKPIPMGIRQDPAGPRFDKRSISDCATYELSPAFDRDRDLGGRFGFNAQTVSSSSGFSTLTSSTER